MTIIADRLGLGIGCGWGCTRPHQTWTDRLHSVLGHWGFTRYPGSITFIEWEAELGPVRISWWRS